MLCTYLLLFNCQGSIASKLLRRKLCYYITSLSLCQYLFEKFVKFFSWFLTSRFSVIAVRFAHNSLIISHSIPFVNTFLKSFLKSFFQTSSTFHDRQGCVLYIKPCFTQLDYYSTIKTKSQYLFSIFFNIVRYDKTQQKHPFQAVKIYKRAYFLTLKRLKSQERR